MPSSESLEPGFKQPPRKKVGLAPGHSPLDWARLKQTSSIQKLTGQLQLQKYTSDQLSQHRTAGDVWVSLRGRVYNIAAYLPFHPGGERILMPVAGRDASDLFDKYHPWVNAEMLLDKCLVGFLIY